MKWVTWVGGCGGLDRGGFHRQLALLFPLSELFPLACRRGTGQMMFLGVELTPLMIVDVWSGLVWLVLCPKRGCCSGSAGFPE